MHTAYVPQTDIGVFIDENIKYPFKYCSSIKFSNFILLWCAIFVWSLAVVKTSEKCNFVCKTMRKFPYSWLDLHTCPLFFLSALL